MKETGIFRSDALDLFSSEHPVNKRYFPTPHTEDRIAWFFCGPAFDLISRAAHAARKAAPGSSKEIFGNAEFFFALDNVEAQALLRKFIDEDSPRERVKEDRFFLDMLRETYRTTIRGAYPKCWTRLERAVESGEARCRGSEECFGEEEGADRAGLQCETYHVNWRTTSLALKNGRLKSSSRQELCRSLFKAAPVLELVADPDALGDYIERELFHVAGDDDRRSPRGLAVRLLTLFVEFCLCDLNERLQLPVERELRFLS